VREVSFGTAAASQVVVVADVNRGVPEHEHQAACASVSPRRAQASTEPRERTRWQFGWPSRALFLACALLVSVPDDEGFRTGDQVFVSQARPAEMCLHVYSLCLD
jgi:hypothetical protein